MTFMVRRFGMILSWLVFARRRGHRRDAVASAEPRTQGPSSFVGWPSAGVPFPEQSLHAPAQAVHLIDEMQDDRDAFIVDAEVLTQIANELGAREVDVGKHQLRFGLRRNEPAGRDPGFEPAMLQVGANQKFLNRDHSNLQMLAGILALPRLPAPREFLDLRIELLRQNDLESHVFVAMTLAAARRALAFEPEHRPRIRAFGDRHAYRSGRGGDVELRPEHRFGQANRQFEVDVVALAGEELVRLHLDLHQRVAGRTSAESRPTLAAQPQNLLIPGAGRNHDIEGAAVGQRDAFGCAVEGLQEFDRQAVKGILPAHAKAAFAAAAPEHFLEDILRVHEIGEAAAAAVGVRFVAGAVEIAVIALARAFVPGGIDLAAVEARPFLGIAHEVVGSRDLLELLLRLLIAGIEVRVQLFRQLTIGLADLVLRRLRLHAQDSVGILAHVALLA